MRSLLLIACTACGRVGFDEGAIVAPGSSDARDDSALDAGTMTPRVISQAYWTNWFGTEIGTPNTNFTGYSLPTAGVVDGELLVIVACVDNGSDTVWPNPLGAGFTQLYQKRWGNDGQSCAIDWKIAANEPATYTGTYGPGIISASSLLALVAIPGVASIGDTAFFEGSGTGVNPVPQMSTGVTTTKPDSLVVYASASDWECYEVSDVSFTTPSGFSSLFVSTDRGGTTKDWTAFQIATRAVAQPGSTGPITSTETSTGSSACVADPWTAAFVVEP